MKVYRLKHLPTGLYFKPSKGSGNLSKKGKLYPEKKPSLEWVEYLKIVIYSHQKDKEPYRTIINRFSINLDNVWKYEQVLSTNKNDWEIEEVE